MFGYIYVNEQELKLREFVTYRSFYCGLCDELHRRYGRSAQMVLNYDMTFLALLLTGLYEPETIEDEQRCILHPVRRHKAAHNDAVTYAADMCVLLAYQKAMDDWEDEHSVSRRALAALLKSGYERASGQYPRQAKAVDDNIRQLHEVERKSASRRSAHPAQAPGEAAEGDLPDIDYVAGLTGGFLSELFVWKDDIWQDDLRQIGFYLGKFVYLMDALEDIEKDRKHGSYNVFADEGDVWEGSRMEEIQAILTGMMTEASRAFERLPVLEYAPILRNILYSGVWCRYAALRENSEKRRK